jgi:F420-dependent oxidoreductase-like protein
MKFSIWPRSSVPYAELLAAARHAEASGWDGLWIADHFMPNDADTSGPTGEAWTTVAALAGSVPRVRIGTLVSGNTYRHPAVLAKMAAQVDIVSGGRFTLGLGAGWQRNEHEAYGIEFSTVKGRLDRLEEASELIVGLLTNAATTFEGEYYRLTDAPLSPKPVQRPLPLLIGGGGERRTLRIAARFANAWNVWGSPETLRRKGEVLERHCADVGRDPKQIERSANALLQFTEDEASAKAARSSGRPVIAGTPEQVRDQVREYAAAGVDELIIPDFNLGGPEQRAATYDRFMREVVPEFR